MPLINPINHNGPDIKAMVEAVVDAEMAPAEQSLQRREQQLTREQETLTGTYQAIVALEQSALWLANEAMVNGQGNGNRAGRWLAVSSEPERLGVRVTGYPDPGTYQLKIHQLASPQVLVSPAFTEEPMLPGNGNLHISLNGNNWTVNLLPNSSLSSIAQTIQLNTRGKIRGTVISGLDGQRLLLTGAEKGAGWRIRLSGKGAGADLAAMMSEQKAPADALVTIDDVELRLPGNIAQRAIRGLSIDLKQADVGRLITIDVSQDIEPMVNAMTEFVDNCNQLVLVSDPRDEQGRQINADAPASLRGISSQLRRLMMPASTHTDTVTGSENPEPVNSLLDLGVSTQRNGLWSLNNARFRAQLDFAPYHVLAFLTDPQQPVMAIASRMQSLTDGKGTLHSRATYLSRSLQRLSAERLKLDHKRQIFTDRTSREFIRMDQNMKRFTRTRENIENSYPINHTINHR